MRMTFPITTGKSAAIPIHLVTEKSYAAWLNSQNAARKKWLSTLRFKAKPGRHTLLADPQGNIAGVLCVTDANPGTWSIAHLAEKLPPYTYALAGRYKKEVATKMALGWALACYEFTRYKKSATTHAKLQAPHGCDVNYVKAMAESICWARDMVNTPTNDMNTVALANEAASWAKKAGGTVKVVKDKTLLQQNYPLIYTVGKASESPPHLVDIRFPRKGAPKVTLVGKGVCFDSGGLDIKPSEAMRLMKKDMAGVAVMLALAKTLRETKIPVQLRLLLPIVENSVSGNAMRPLDVVTSRKGLTVEIGNTDAEGRLILCDALSDADDEKPDLIIDCASLTGAARIALGTDIPAFFTPDDTLAGRLEKCSREQEDALWRLPLHAPYRAMMDSTVADISNDASSGYGGAITAALYLKEFVTNTHSWMHIDMMAWNLSNRPGRPKGGEAMAVRALYDLIKTYYGK